jgi:hypothetical protein
MIAMIVMVWLIPQEPTVQVFKYRTMEICEKRRIEVQKQTEMIVAETFPSEYHSVFVECAKVPSPTRLGG